MPRRGQSCALYAAQFFQPFWQLLIDSAESAVREDRHYIAAAQLRSNGFNNRIRVGDFARRLPCPLKAVHYGRGRQALVFRDSLRLEDRRDYNLVGPGKAADQFFLQNFPAQSVRPRLKDCPQPSTGIAHPQRAQGGCDGRWMMGKIVDDGDAVNLCLDLQAALHALKTLER